jgi:hypothetical protein
LLCHQPSRNGRRTCRSTPTGNYQWYRVGPIGQYNSSAPRNNQGAPLTPEYQKIFEDNLEDVKQGGQGTDPTYTCLPDGMPRLMNVIFSHGDRGHAQDDLFFDRVSDAAAPHLHGWPHHAGGCRAVIRRLLDRHLA